MYAKSFALAGLAGSFVVAASASASYTGLTVEAYAGGSDAQNWLDNDYAGLTTYRMYANFVEDGEDDGVLSVFGIDGVTISMNSWDGSFHNDPIFGGNTPPNDFRGVGIWTAEWDTYVTIGSSHTPPTTNVSPGFATATDNLGSDWNSQNVGWFVTPDDDQSLPVNGQVLLMQFSVASQGGDGLLDAWGTFNILLRNDAQIRGIEWSASTPAPGALALLGLAGLASARRRRA